MADELQRLLLKIEADTANLRHALKDATAGIDSFGSKTEDSLSRISGRFDSFGSTVQRVMGAVVAAFATQGIFNQLEQIGQINDLSEVLGMSAKQYQELAYAARINGIEHTKFVDILRTFSGQLGEARTGTGEFYKLLKDHLPTVKDQILQTKGTYAAFLQLADVVSRLSSAEEQAVVAKKALGEQGIFLLRTLREGADGLARIGAEAEKAGAILGGRTVHEVSQLNKEFRKASATLDVEFKRALVELVPLLTDATRWFADMSGSLRKLFGEDIAASAREQLRLVAGWIESILELAAKLPFVLGAQAKLAIAGLRTVLDAQGKLLDITPKVTPQVDTAKADVALGSWAAKVEREGKPALKLVPKLDIGKWKTEVSTKGADALIALEKKAAEARRGGLEAIRIDQEKEIERFRRLLADGLIDQKDFHSAREMLQEVSSRKIQDFQKKELDDMRANFSHITSVIEGSLGNAFDEVFKTGRLNVKAFFADLLAGLAKAILQAMILKPLMDSLTQGLGGSAFGSLFSLGKRASGGPVTAGRPYLVGEQGPELMVPNSSGSIVPNNRLSTGGAGGPVNVVYNVDARAADPGVAARIMAALQQIERQRPDPVQSVAMMRNRFPTRAFA